MAVSAIGTEGHDDVGSEVSEVGSDLGGGGTRFSLIEFQQDLVRRLNAAAAPDAPSSRLGVHVRRVL